MLDNLRKTLIEDEGVVWEIYLDHLGNPTFGIGHLIAKHDPEYGKPVGTPVSEERVVEAFAVDSQDCVNGALTLDENLFNRPEDVQIVICSMVFQMGRFGVSKFRNMWKAIYAEDYAQAAVEMLDSKWAKQTPNRANRLARRMRNAKA